MKQRLQSRTKEWWQSPSSCRRSTMWRHSQRGLQGSCPTALLRLLRYAAPCWPPAALAYSSRRQLLRDRAACFLQVA